MINRPFVAIAFLLAHLKFARFVEENGSVSIATEGIPSDNPLAALLTLRSTLFNAAEFISNFSKSDMNLTTSTEIEIKRTESSQQYPKIARALQDIAYYLRAHKFNEYDRRYQHRAGLPPRKYFAEFPRPPLRSLHWEVHKYCETSFPTCVDYLHKRIRHAGLKRQDDTSIVIQEQKWDLKNHSKLIEVVDNECHELLKADAALADPFQGPIERFQWRTTASYYMCWYTMNEMPDLKDLKESCDNFANCLDRSFGVHNRDPRANPRSPFSCALYSFCPDPCCPYRHLKGFDECWNGSENPCFSENADGKRICKINRAENRELSDIVLNRWNVTCKCPRNGFEWDSKYGMCVDVDECLSGLHGCSPVGEACVNLPGSFKCACRWGYGWNAIRKVCEPSPALEIIKLHNRKIVSETRDRNASSIVKKLFNAIFGRNECNRKSPSFLFALLADLIAVYIGFW